MRLRLCFLLVVLSGMAFSQDTNFAQGPQYLAPNISPLFLQPIATPSLSFSAGLVDPYGTATELTPSQALSGLAGTPDDIFLGQVYWGKHESNEILARRISTPSLTAEQTAENYYGTAALAANALTVPPSVPIEQVLPSSVVEMVSGNIPSNLPSSIVDPGVTGTADTQSLLNRGYGTPLGTLASRWKGQRGSAHRTLTNEDLRH